MDESVIIIIDRGISLSDKGNPKSKESELENKACTSTFLNVNVGAFSFPLFIRLFIINFIDKELKIMKTMYFI